MILLDTSVWIEFFRQNPDYIETIQPLLGAQRIVSFEPIFSELLYGVRDKKEKGIIQSYWKVLPRLEFGSNFMIEAAEYANTNNFFQLGIGLMDAMIIKAAIQGNHQLWTLDGRINNYIDLKMQFKPSNLM